MKPTAIIILGRLRLRGSSIIASEQVGFADGMSVSMAIFTSQSRNAKSSFSRVALPDGFEGNPE